MNEEAVIEQLTEKANRADPVSVCGIYNGLTAQERWIPPASLKAKLADGIGLTKATSKCLASAIRFYRCRI